MIYDSDKVESLIARYVQGEEEVVGEIIEESVSLVEVIVSRYDQYWRYREDMIQECLLKITQVLDKYNPEVASAHNFFTSVITNCCIDFINKLNREQKIIKTLCLDPDTFRCYKIPPSEEHLLVELKERNRRRFPTFPPSSIDLATEHIYHYIVEGVHGKSRGAIKELTDNFHLNRREATVLYHSSLAYLRHLYSMEAAEELEEPDEVSLLPDLEEIIGKEAYNHIALVFGGMYIKFP